MTSYYNARNVEILRDEEEDRQSRRKADRWIFRLLLLAVAFVPLLVGGYVKDVLSPHITSIGLLMSGSKGDMFTHYKAVALMIITLIAIVLLLSKVFFMNGEIRKTKLNWFIGLFMVAIVISTLLSPSKTIALWGQYNRSDGAISYLCYLTLFFVALNIQYPKKALHYVMYSLYPFVLINFVFITMNFKGHDAMTYPAVQKAMSLFLPEGASLDENSLLIGTLNQWNFMSGMFAIVTVMYLAWAIIDTNKIRSVVNMIVANIALAVMLMSISTSGFFTLVVLTPFLIVLVFKAANRKMAALVLIVFFVLCVPTLHVLASDDPRVWNESIGFIIKKNPYEKEKEAAASVTDRYSFSFEHRAYAADNHFELPKLPESGVSAGSGRMYIWGKTFELTMKRPAFGYGMDTLMYHFPHYNIDARAGLSSETNIVDKPHSMYVGIFYGTGIVGLLGFLGIAVITSLMALKAIFTQKYNVAAVFGIAWLAFLVQALFNDTLPGTAAPLWTLVGMMVAYMYTNKEGKELSDGRND